MRRDILSWFLFVLPWHLPSAAQIVDDFSDRDLVANPIWTGDLDRWQTGTLMGNPALQSFGAATSDTIFLALRTDAAFGTWEFTFAHRDVNLSTFNGARVFISVDHHDPGGLINGYFIQVGTNNSDAVSLWRVDGDLGKRVELARSSVPLVIGDSSQLRITVQRRLDARWQVSVSDSVVFGAVDARYVNGDHLIVWVKHTQQGAEAFFFDDLSIEPQNGGEPAPDPPDKLPQAGDIVINEVQFDPLPGSSEFVELYNRSDSTFDLQHITFRDSRSPPLEIVDSTSVLAPGAFAVIAADREAFSSQFRRTPFHDPSRWAALNNGGDHIVIEAGGAVVDSLAYSPEASRRGYSLERIDPYGPSDLLNFAPSLNPFGATPGEVNSVFEIDDRGPRLLFAEQWTPNSLRLYFDEPLDVDSLSAENVRVGSISPEAITTDDGSVVTASFSAMPASTSVEVKGVVDRRGNVSGRVAASLAFLPEPGEIVINEIMYEPLADAFDGRPNQTEYVELVNRSSRTLTLSGLHATRRVDEDGDADTIDVSIERTAIAPNEIFVVADDSSLSRQLPDVSVAVVSINLPNTGGVFRLGHRSGSSIDSLVYHSNLHHPDLIATRGIALERIDTSGPSHPSNWTSSVDAAGGTPGRTNSVSSGIAPQSMPYGITVTPNPFSPDRDGIDDIATVSYRLRSDVALVRIRIFDRRGVQVRELVPSGLVNAHGTAYWNGLDELGRRLRIGVYIVLLEAFDVRMVTAESHRSVVVLARRL